VLLRATGAAAHVAALEAHAAEQGALFGPVGLYRGSERVPCPEEAGVYAALGLHPTAPERREEGVPLLALGKARPRLLRREDLRGALHNHTTASDGVHGLTVMRDAARLLGLGWLGVSEHSQSAAYAGGLEPAALERQLAEIARLNGDDAGCTLLTGVESDILRDGELDYADALLARLDVVVASVHTRFRQTPEEMTRRMVNAASNPWADVIGHPTGRLLLGRPASEYDVEALIDACAASGCALELNANPQRLDLGPRYLAMAKERGVKVSIAADAHSAPALSHLDFGVTVARRAGLTPEDVLNGLTLPELRAWLAPRKARAAAAVGA
ncbi:MAG: PHP domain-containing protein, partial [Deltaproteobacteria bacterium]